MSVVRSLTHANTCRMWLYKGCSEKACQSQEAKVRVDERNSQVEFSLGSNAFAAFLSLFVQSWKCDILKIVFIETNVKRGESY